MSDSLFLELELLDPVAVTAHSATVGGHESLTWIPGGQLLGATAAAIRHRPDGALPDEVWRILLSGEVRFGDAWPAVDGRPAFPAPLALHVPKGAEEPVHNLALADRRGKSQLEQIRDRHVTADGRKVELRRHHTLRTAVEEEGRAREGFLFGIEALEAGQRFLSRVDADDPALLVRVRSLLDGQEIVVGRSRSAEFGRVRVRCVAPWEEPACGPVTDRLVLWLVADLALRDALTGAPRLQLTPDDLGLPSGWGVRWDQSFVRTRRYSPFNGTRLRPDLERQLLRPGSVVVLEGPRLAEGAAQALVARLRRGVGEYVQEGFGRMIVNPTLLATEEVSLVEVTPADEARPALLPDDPLGRWLQGRLQELERADEDERQARELYEKLRRHRQVRRSQWGEIRRIAREARYSAEPERRLVEQLEAFLNHGARLHAWPAEARKHLLEQAGRLRPAAIERAAALMRSPSREVER